MDWDILILFAAYLIAGFLVFLLVHLKGDPERRREVSLGMLLGNITFVFFIFYAFPFVVFLTISFVKVVVIEKYSLYQFREHVFSVLLDQFNGYYVGAWNWVKDQIRERFLW